MLKLEIKLDENKISKEQKYSASSIYQILGQAFDSYQLRKEYEPDGTIVFLEAETLEIMEHLDVLLHL